MTSIVLSVNITAMLKVRLQRVGRKHETTFRVVLTDSKNSTKSGKFLEVLGSYDPRKTLESFDGERIKEWIGKGAKLSDTLHNLLISKKIIEGKKINVLPRKSPYKSEKVLAAEKEAADAQAAKEAEEKAKQDALEAEKEKKEADELAEAEQSSEGTPEATQPSETATEDVVTPSEEPKVE